MKTPTSPLTRYFLLLALWLLPLFVYADITSGLVAHYPFSGNSNDASGNDNNGLYEGNVTFSSTGVSGTAATYTLYNGVTPGLVSVPNSSSLQFDGNATFSAWFRLDGYDGIDGYGAYVSSGAQMVIMLKDRDAQGLYAMIQTSSPQIATISDNFGNLVQAADLTLSLGIWHLFTAPSTPPHPNI